MIETKNLEELVNEGKIELFKHRRELLISPIDSGRLNLIVSQSHLFNNILYVCDTKKRKKQIEDELAKTNATNITVLTYYVYYQKQRWLPNEKEDKCTKNFDLVVCDNIHYIIKFRERAMYLAHFIWFFFFDETVFSAPDRLQILMMTDEPQYIEEFQQQIPWVNTYHTIELKDN